MDGKSGREESDGFADARVWNSFIFLWISVIPETGMSSSEDEESPCSSCCASCKSAYRLSGSG